MKNNISFNFFESYEEQIIFFSNNANVIVLPMTEGKSAFFSRLGSWFRDYESQKDPLHISCIPPNPAQGMSFPTPLDVISTALMVHRNTRSVDKEAISLLIEFGLCADKASQPIVTLSGGELLLLNYAKAKAMRPTVTGLVACSPVLWLNKCRYGYWDILVDDYVDNGKFINVALLEGEPFPHINNTEHDIYEQQENTTSLKWKLIVNYPKVVFPEIYFPTYHPESSIDFSNEAIELDLISPTLITGDNGVGKSILAKLMAGIEKPVEGNIFSLSENGKGYSRLIFQDSIDQIFGMTIDSHIDWIFRFDDEKSKLAKTIYSAIEGALRKHMSKIYFEGLTAFGKTGKRTTLLQTKICLVSERVASRPPVLVFDEPGWGLSKTVTRCLLREVCKQAHNYGVAIAIISHQQNWWEGLCHSHIKLTKRENNTVNISVLEMKQ